MEILQSKAYVDRELESYREALSQTELSLSSKGNVNLEGSERFSLYF